ncbi:chascon isoform d-related [Anaeramoeba flamelloides]|uniref:Chascon isoform d-related n=1 Tax=Anaeramoeba flamelloides TaxID=1746091 RepID=A0AAV7ZGD4_9EUKA|nr:chascon isoform d-related [Anaeramoeba flamelloides]
MNSPINQFNPRKIKKIVVATLRENGPVRLENIPFIIERAFGIECVKKLEQIYGSVKQYLLSNVSFLIENNPRFGEIVRIDYTIGSYLSSKKFLDLENFSSTSNKQEETKTINKIKRTNIGTEKENPEVEQQENKEKVKEKEIDKQKQQEKEKEKQQEKEEEKEEEEEKKEEEKEEEKKEKEKEKKLKKEPNNELFFQAIQSLYKTKSFRSEIEVLEYFQSLLYVNGTITFAQAEEIFNSRIKKEWVFEKIHNCFPSIFEFLIKYGYGKIKFENKRISLTELYRKEMSKILGSQIPILHKRNLFLQNKMKSKNHNKKNKKSNRIRKQKKSKTKPKKNSSELGTVFGRLDEKYKFSQINNANNKIYCLIIKAFRIIEIQNQKIESIQKRIKILQEKK